VSVCAVISYHSLCHLHLWKTQLPQYLHIFSFKYNQVCNYLSFTHAFQDVLNSSTASFAEVLNAEGVSAALQEVLLYGIAMCDYSQHSTFCLSKGTSLAISNHCQDSSCSSSASSSSHVTNSTLVQGQLQSQLQHQVHPLGATPHNLTACEGLQALQLMADSIARFSSQGAFMLPSWGCGSLPEAFVR
jgi:hypothetical protein